MKISFLALFACCIIKITLAQNIFVEHFNTGEIPQNWTIDQFEGNWSCEQSKKALGKPSELRLSPSPEFTGTTRIISPEINLVGYTQIYLRFKHFLDQIDTANCEIGIATCSNGGDWNIVWQVSDPIGPVGPASEFVFIDNGDVGQEDFQFCFFFSGSSTDINYWFIDDIALFNQLETDLEFSSLYIPKYGLADYYTVHGRITNLGSTTINSVYLNYQINDGDINSIELHNLDLDFTEGLNFTADEQIFLTSGEKSYKVWISEINYLGNDDNPLNDTLSHVINIASDFTQRLLLFEEFASSTCVNCVYMNDSILHPLLAANEGKYSLIKYPMNYPSPGDPYFIESANIKKDYYGTSMLPYLLTDGGFGVMSQYHFNIRYNNPALVEISSIANISGGHINISTSILPFVNISDATVYIAVVEKTTTGNVQNNGETEFYNVLMDMLPSADGIDFTGSAGTLVQINESKDLSGTFIEDFEDLEVIVYLQDNETKQVFQSNISDLTVSVKEVDNIESDLKIYPNPFKDRVTIKVLLSDPSDIVICIRSIQGQLVKMIINPNLPAGTHQIVWDGTDHENSKVTAGLYFGELICNGRRISNNRIIKVQ